MSKSCQTNEKLRTFQISRKSKMSSHVQNIIFKHIAILKSRFSTYFPKYQTNYKTRNVQYFQTSNVQMFSIFVAPLRMCSFCACALGLWPTVRKNNEKRKQSKTKTVKSLRMFIKACVRWTKPAHFAEHRSCHRRGIY